MTLRQPRMQERQKMCAHLRHPGSGFAVKREPFHRFHGRLPKSQGQNPVLTVLYVPYLLDSVGVEGRRSGGDVAPAADAGEAEDVRAPAPPHLTQSSFIAGPDSTSFTAGPDNI